MTVADALLNSLLSDVDNVRVGNKDALLKKLQALNELGKNNIHVVSDFDMTITSYWYSNGVRNTSSHGVLDGYEKVPPQVSKKLDELFTHYYAIETDTALSVAEKTPKMVEWWERSHALISQVGFTVEDLKQMAKTCKIAFRSSTKELVDFLDNNQIPLLVFSAGVYDVIYFLLKTYKFKPDNVHIVSNRMQFTAGNKPVDTKAQFGGHYLDHIGNDSVCTGFIDPLIHCFNKGEAVLSPDNSVYFSALRKRPGVILMGDSLSDIEMSHDSPTVLKIGFLNHKVDQLLDRYMNTFDIVFLNDIGFEPVLNILKNIC